MILQPLSASEARPIYHGVLSKRAKINKVLFLFWNFYQQMKGERQRWKFLWWISLSPKMVKNTTLTTTKWWSVLLAPIWSSVAANLSIFNWSSTATLTRPRTPFRSSLQSPVCGGGTNPVISYNSSKEIDIRKQVSWLLFSKIIRC